MQASNDRPAAETTHADSKPVYEAPSLVRHGTVQELTQVLVGQGLRGLVTSQ